MVHQPAKSKAISSCCCSAGLKVRGPRGRGGYRQRRGHLLFNPGSSLIHTFAIHALEVDGGTLQSVRVPQETRLDAPHYHRLAQMTELLLKDSATPTEKGEMACDRKEQSLGDSHDASTQVKAVCTATFAKLLVHHQNCAQTQDESLLCIQSDLQWNGCKRGMHNAHT